MMDYWNVVVEFNHIYQDDDFDDELIDVFADWHVVVGESDSRRVEATVSIPAENLRQACLVVFALLSSHDSFPDVAKLSAMRSSEYDKMHGFTPVPPMLSVTEAAALVGVTRQRILQMIKEGTLHGVKVGNSWALTRAEIDNMVSGR